jgi:hypothetical protein
MGSLLASSDLPFGSEMILLDQTAAKLSLHAAVCSRPLWTSGTAQRLCCPSGESFCNKKASRLANSGRQQTLKERQKMLLRAGYIDPSRYARFPSSLNPRYVVISLTDSNSATHFDSGPSQPFRITAKATSLRWSSSGGGLFERASCDSKEFGALSFLHPTLRSAA